MNITVNGNSKSIQDISTISDLLTDLGLPPDTVVVELNTSIVTPDSYNKTELAEDDRVEIIRFVGGG
ncbi:thiamine biosynthesis protein ThiS [Desulfocapsa sulfexigens DSM 10523]|uniref:Thiamine biosynthesis protein ThiS n=1 Tax=Desulfocapsa sulfexigens (strain DSM 10523 / SB164P1) TaxID=1167006 RepID=M1PPY9_DESSD|nr:sulfur carrier protein ThiS [Desulfocapsa sulfexigens]AGF78451.1 thiamine biosynthesis protein ThiS [Desulfocapsa sulfexigens DSM 10523]